MASSTANCLCHKSGAAIGRVGKPPTSRKRSAFRPNPNWREPHGAPRPGRRFAHRLGGGRYGSQATAPTCASGSRSKATPTRLAVPCTEVVCVQTKEGCLLSDVASIAVQALGEKDWQRLSQSLGTKGERLFDWAMLPLVHRGTVDGRHWLVFRRCLDEPFELAYYLVFAPLATSLPTIVQAIGARWRIEEDLEANKDLGLDHYEVRSYVGWYRHITLVMLATAFLVGICVQENPPLPAEHEALLAPPVQALIALTTSEVRHLLARLIWPAPSGALLICQWSCWRRAHQSWAGYYHRRRRLKAG